MRKLLTIGALVAGLALTGVAMLTDADPRF